MQKTTLKAFNLIGIKSRTTNENDQAGKDIPALWEEFITKNVQERIPNKIDSSILSLYTNYESDHTKPYDAILGCRVSSLDTIPEGMIGLSFSESRYEKITKSGDLTKGLVYNTWLEIWNNELPRSYTADFEVYDHRAQNWQNAEVDIFVALTS